MTTGIGGGAVRDLLLREIPLVLRKEIYAVAALAGRCSSPSVTHCDCHPVR